MLNKAKIISHYILAKNIANNYLAKRKLYSAAKYTGLAAYIAYTYKFRYFDDDLEKIIQNISTQIISKKPDFSSKKNKIVFYDSFAEDNRALTQQYIRAIFSWEYELLYITPRSEIDNEILQELKRYAKSKIIILMGNKTSFETQVKKAVKEITFFRPQYAFLQFKPWDIFGMCIWTAFENIERYFINLTDDAFWLGKCCSDYFFEFRRFGASLSVNSRNIPIEKLLFQPYYPIQANTSFKGFPISKDSKTLVFAGANFYKIYGCDGIFLELINTILKKYKNVALLYAGDGNQKLFEKFIRDNKLANQVYILGPRKDINSVIKNIDIFINTFPVAGGLMSQLAAVNKKPIISYSNEELYAFNDIEDFLQTETSGLLIKTSKDGFLSYFDLLINDYLERKRNVEATCNSIISPVKFNKLLLENITSKKHIENNFFKNTKIDEDAICNLFIEMENKYLKNHYNILWFVGPSLIFDSFFLGIKVLLLKVTNIILNKANSTLKRIIKS